MTSAPSDVDCADTAAPAASPALTSRAIQTCGFIVGPLSEIDVDPEERPDAVRPFAQVVVDGHLDEEPPKSRQSGICSMLKLRPPEIFEAVPFVGEQLVLAPATFEIAAFERALLGREPTPDVMRPIYLRGILQRDKAEAGRGIHLGRRLRADLERVELESRADPRLETLAFLRMNLACSITFPGVGSSQTGGLSFSSGAEQSTSAVRTPCIVSPSNYQLKRGCPRRPGRDSRS